VEAVGGGVEGVGHAARRLEAHDAQRLAQVHVAAAAGAARTARQSGLEHHAAADPGRIDALADGLHLGHQLVAGEHRVAHEGVVAVEDVDVGAADADGPGAQARPPGAGLGGSVTASTLRAWGRR
jgi:hypothetical protein